MRAEDVKGYIGNFGTDGDTLEKYVDEILKKGTDDSNPKNVKMYYNSLQKYALLRELDAGGFDISDFFNPKEVNPIKAEEIYKNFEASTAESIAEHVRNKIINITADYIGGEEKESKKAGGAAFFDVKEDWKKDGMWGLGYASAFMTSITHGLKKKSLTIASAPTGVGKTRTTISHMVHSCASEYYSRREEKWLKNPHGANRALYICTEMLLKDEIDPLITAYIADVPEGHIKYNQYEGREEERVNRAIMQVLDDSHIYLEYMPNYTISELEQIISLHKIKHKIDYVFFDYIHSTPALVNEYTLASGGKTNVREDQVLADVAAKLKTIARKYDVAVLTCTQVNGEYKNVDARDESIVRGSKAIIDKADTAYILTRPTNLELEKINSFIYMGPEFFPTPYELNDPKTAKEDLKKSGVTLEERRKQRSRGAKDFEKKLYEPAEPNLCCSIYKNRGGEYVRVKVWLYIDYSTMRTHDLYVTDYDCCLDAKTIAGLEKKYLIRHKNGEGFVLSSTAKMEELEENFEKEDEYDEEE